MSDLVIAFCLSLLLKNLHFGATERSKTLFGQQSRFQSHFKGWKREAVFERLEYCFWASASIKTQLDRNSVKEKLLCFGHLFLPSCGFLACACLRVCRRVCVYEQAAGQITISVLFCIRLVWEPCCYF